MRATADGRPVPVVGQWVILHRVGSDRAGPVDSVRSAADGRFRFRYSRSGSADALYFVSSLYSGIAYFSPPLRADTVRGDDADVMVYDTTSAATSLRVVGRHFVMSAPGLGNRREVAEVFEVENQGSRTIVARDSTTPIWFTHLPATAEGVSVSPGDISAGAVVFRSARADVYAPISPGVRQLVITYTLPAKAFPVSLPVAHDVSVLEVLVEEPRAEVAGARLSETAPALIDGRNFRRFIAQDVSAASVVSVSAPSLAERDPAAMRVLAIVMALAMLGAIAAWTVRRRRVERTEIARHAATDSERLVAALAALDARFERESAASPPPDARSAYERERADLRARLERALARERQPV